MWNSNINSRRLTRALEFVKSPLPVNFKKCLFRKNLEFHLKQNFSLRSLTEESLEYLMIMKTLISLTFSLRVRLQ